MIHLFKHKDGKYDIALVVKGRFIVGSQQHYNRKGDALKIMRYINSLIWQDDTLPKPKVFRGTYSTGVLIYEEATDVKLTKKYIPSTRKKK